MSERKAVIKNADMSEDMQQDAIDSATQVRTLPGKKKTVGRTGGGKRRGEGWGGESRKWREGKPLTLPWHDDRWAACAAYRSCQKTSIATLTFFSRRTVPVGGSARRVLSTKADEPSQTS